MSGRYTFCSEQHCKRCFHYGPNVHLKRQWVKVSPAIFKSGSIEPSAREVAARLSSIREKESGIVLPQSKAAAAAEGSSPTFKAKWHCPPGRD
ncbi:MAG: hypothetical protein AB1611_08060 [bacterium]